MQTVKLRYWCTVFSCILLPSCLSDSYLRFNTAEKIKSNKCSALLQNFASFASNFTYCTINYSRPITLCERCVKEYLNVLEAHREILELKDESGVKCKEKLVNQDRLEVIDSAYQYVSGLWSNGHCDNCFVKQVNGSITPQLANSTIEFQHLHSKTHKCLVDHFIETNGTFDKNVCEDCENVYCEMNDYYDNLKKSEKMEVCVDIIDTMNITRSFWSTKLGCGKKDQSIDISLVSLFTVISVIPIIFYASLRTLVRKTEHRLLVQKRLAEHLSRTICDAADT